MTKTGINRLIRLIDPRQIVATIMKEILLGSNLENLFWDTLSQIWHDNEGIPVIRTFLEKFKVNPNLTIGDQSALQFVVSRREFQLVKLLLEYGADPNIRNRLGRTPLFYIVIVGDKPKAIIKLLMECGADPDIEDNFQLTPRRVAGRDPDILKLLDQK